MSTELSVEEINNQQDTDSETLTQCQIARGERKIDRRNGFRFLYLALACGLSYVTAMVISVFVHPTTIVVKLTLVILPTAVFIQALRAYLYFFRSAEELTKKIQIEGLKLGFCAGLVFLFPYSLLVRFGAPAELEALPPMSC